MPDAHPGPDVDETAASMLEAMFTSSPIGLHLLDPHLRVVRINTATPAMQGVALEDVIGRPARDVFDLVENHEMETLLRKVLDTGVPLRERIVRAVTRAAPTRAHYFEVTAQRLANQQRKVLGLVVTLVDVTERERGRAGVHVLDAVRRCVGRTLDPAATGDEFAGAVVPAFADIAVVEVVDSVMRGDDPPQAPLPPGTPLMRTAFRSGHPHPLQAHPLGDVRLLPAPTPFTQALTDLRPRLVPLDPSAPWLPTDRPRADAIQSAQAHTLLVVPLALRDAALGLVSLYRTGKSPPFDEADQKLAVEVAAHTALSIDNARRFTREHAIAATVQRRLLPRRPETHASLEAAYLSPTGAAPGAWYDTIALSSARTALVVGNVSGQGLNAAATMGQMRTVIRALSAFDLAPDELLARLQDTATGLATERANLPLGDPLRREALTADCVYAIHDPLAGTCVMATAGPLAPVTVHPDHTLTVPDPPTGPLLGSRENTPFAAVSFEVPAGSTLVFTSDPLLTTYLSESSLPLNAARDYADRPLQELCDALVYALPEGVGAGDAAVIVARTRPFPPDRVAAWQFDRDPASVAVARARAGRQLSAWRVNDETAFDAQLIVSELVTNAVRYGAPPIEFRLIRNGTLTCEVRDTGKAAPHLRHARTVDEGGRGLFIAARLAQAWGTRYTPKGKTVWTEQALPARHD
ncbi:MULTISPECIES: SpoIIE family protein phosphatase [unclassified Streptomyces]|uniref:SpoIIE family protein phosphatase n=1 Tax=unclassified Streptomyces TaxID=2593676 RepID=UPI0033D0DFD9